MFLDYFALVVALMGGTLVFYGFVYIHDIPYNIAKKRNHPQVEAIHAACWLSLFTLHALWPIVFLWAVSKGQPIPVTIAGQSAGAGDLEQRLERLEADVRT